MDGVSVRCFPFGGDEWRASLALREAVLRRPLGLDLSIDKIDGERGDAHVGAFLDGRLVGSLLLTAREQGEVQMRAVAVEPGLQRRGVGGELVRFAEAVARERGFSRMVLNAREMAVAFYAKLGYAVVGEPFVLNTLPHRRMQKALTDPGTNP
jgi:ribosomal protein S18 acetylase RimI-like enzyme